MLKIQENPIRYPSVVHAFCSYPFVRLKATCVGDVTMCCYQERKCLGNLFEKSFEEIWFGTVAEAIRADTLRNFLHPMCKVSACPFYHRELHGKAVSYQGYPGQYEIDLPTQHCNIGGENPSPENPACIMCERHTNYIRQTDRLNEVCGFLRPHIGHVHAVHIQGIAEPFWKDRIFEVINQLGIEPLKSRIRISTTTNGTLMTEERRKQLLSYPLSCITWSLDAATPETYVKIRRVPMYEKIVENLLAYCRERRSPDQTVHIHNNINLLNVDEVVGMVELAHKAKVDLIDFNPTISVPTICVDPYNVRVFRDAQKRIIEAARRLEVKTTFMRNLTLDYDRSGQVNDPFQDVRLVQIA